MAKNKWGRPTKYDTKITDMICERLLNWESLMKICVSEDMPDRATIHRWLILHKEFCDKYEQAREKQAETLADEIIHISDTATDSGLWKLRVDARKWVASKLLPKKYWDRITQEHTGVNWWPIEYKELSAYTPDELKAILQSK